MQPGGVEAVEGDPQQVAVAPESTLMAVVQLGGGPSLTIQSMNQRRSGPMAATRVRGGNAPASRPLVRTGW